MYGVFFYVRAITVRNSTKTEKELVLKEGLVLLLGTVLRQRRISTMRGVELRERERDRIKQAEDRALPSFFAFLCVLIKLSICQKEKNRPTLRS